MTTKDSRIEKANLTHETSKHGFEISDAELAHIAGGMLPVNGRYSKTIDVSVGCTDVDAGF